MKGQAEARVTCSSILGFAAWRGRNLALFTVITSCIIIAYIVISQILEWMHHLDTIKERWPRVYRVLLSPGTRLLLLLVAIGLLVDGRVEHSQEGPKAPPAPAQIIEQKAEDSTCSNVVAGKDAQVDCSSGKENERGKKHPKSP